jgi:hypothetical protein
MSIKAWYITGLIEGEGCFSVSFNLRKRIKLGIETRPSFSIALNQRDLNLIKQVHTYFSCGAVRYSRSDRTYKYEVRSISDLAEKIIPHFRKYPLQGSKANDFEKFVEICRCIRSNLHLNKKHLVEIIKMAYKMNPSGKRKYEKNDLLRKLGEIMV